MAERWPIALDFDGVLHQFDEASWRAGLYNRPVPGALEAVRELIALGNEVVVFTARPEPLDVRYWLHAHGFPEMKVTNVKTPFMVILDDRAVEFGGEWNSALIDRLHGFRTYWEAASDQAGE